MGEAPANPVFQGHTQWTGILRWTCFDCGHFNATQFAPGRYVMHCRGCQRHYVRSDRVSRLPKGKHVGPPDCLIPFMALPNAPVPLQIAMSPAEWFEWSSREPANAYDDTELKSNVIIP